MKTTHKVYEDDHKQKLDNARASRGHRRTQSNSQFEFTQLKVSSPEMSEQQRKNKEEFEKMIEINRIIGPSSTQQALEAQKHTIAEKKTIVDCIDENVYAHTADQSSSSGGLFNFGKNLNADKKKRHHSDFGIISCTSLLSVSAQPIETTLKQVSFIARPQEDLQQIKKYSEERNRDYDNDDEEEDDENNDDFDSLFFAKYKNPTVPKRTLYPLGSDGLQIIPELATDLVTSTEFGTSIFKENFLNHSLQSNGGKSLNKQIPTNNSNSSSSEKFYEHTKPLSNTSKFTLDSNKSYIPPSKTTKQPSSTQPQVTNIQTAGINNTKSLHIANSHTHQSDSNTIHIPHNIISTLNIPNIIHIQNTPLTTPNFIHNSQKTTIEVSPASTLITHAKQPSYSLNPSTTFLLQQNNENDIPMRSKETISIENAYKGNSLSEQQNLNGKIQSPHMNEQFSEDSSSNQNGYLSSHFKGNPLSANSKGNPSINYYKGNSSISECYIDNNNWQKPTMLDEGGEQSSQIKQTLHSVVNRSKKINSIHEILNPNEKQAPGTSSRICEENNEQSKGGQILKINLHLSKDRRELTKQRYSQCDEEDHSRVEVSNSPKGSTRYSDTVVCHTEKENVNPYLQKIQEPNNKQLKHFHEETYELHDVSLRQHPKGKPNNSFQISKASSQNANSQFTDAVSTLQHFMLTHNPDNHVKQSDQPLKSNSPSQTQSLQATQKPLTQYQLKPQTSGQQQQLFQQQQYSQTSGDNLHQRKMSVNVGSLKSSNLVQNLSNVSSSGAACHQGMNKHINTMFGNQVSSDQPHHPMSYQVTLSNSNNQIPKQNFPTNHSNVISEEGKMYQQTTKELGQNNRISNVNNNSSGNMNNNVIQNGNNLSSRMSSPNTFNNNSAAMSKNSSNSNTIKKNTNANSKEKKSSITSNPLASKVNCTNSLEGRIFMLESKVLSLKSKTDILQKQNLNLTKEVIKINEEKQFCLRVINYYFLIENIENKQKVQELEAVTKRNEENIQMIFKMLCKSQSDYEFFKKEKHLDGSTNIFTDLSCIDSPNDVSSQIIHKQVLTQKNMNTILNSEKQNVKDHMLYQPKQQSNIPSLLPNSNKYYNENSSFNNLLQQKKQQQTNNTQKLQNPLQVYGQCPPNSHTLKPTSLNNVLF